MNLSRHQCRAKSSRIEISGFLNLIKSSLESFLRPYRYFQYLGLSYIFQNFLWIIAVNISAKFFKKTLQIFHSDISWHNEQCVIWLIIHCTAYSEQMKYHKNVETKIASNNWPLISCNLCWYKPLVNAMFVNGKCMFVSGSR